MLNGDDGNTDFHGMVVVSLSGAMWGEHWEGLCGRSGAWPVSLKSVACLAMSDIR